MSTMTELADPAGHGAGRIGGFTVLFDAGCPICRSAHTWLEGRAQLVPLTFVAAGSAAARRLFPGLDHARTLRDITVVADTGEVYAGDAAWLACLWALTDYRGLADRLARPDLLPTARRVIGLAAAVRERTRAGSYREACADDRCA